MSSHFDESSFDRLRQLDSEETHALVYGAIKKVFDKQKAYVLALCEIKEKLGDLVEAMAPGEDNNIDEYVKLLAACHHYGSRESIYHHTFEMSDMIFRESGSKMNIISLHALFSICLEQNLDCYESLFLVQKFLVAIEESGGIHYEDASTGKRAYDELVELSSSLVPISGDHASASEDYIKTVEFVVHDTRNIN